MCTFSIAVTAGLTVRTGQPRSLCLHKISPFPGRLHGSSQMMVSPRVTIPTVRRAHQGVNEKTEVLRRMPCYPSTWSNVNWVNLLCARFSETPYRSSALGWCWESQFNSRARRECTTIYPGMWGCLALLGNQMRMGA